MRREKIKSPILRALGFKTFEFRGDGTVRAVFTKPPGHKPPKPLTYLKVSSGR